MTGAGRQLVVSTMTASAAFAIAALLAVPALSEGAGRGRR